MPTTELTIGQRIRAERLRLGLTQEACAQALGIRRGSYVQLESATNPKLGTLVPLGDKLGMDLRNIVPELFKARRQAGQPRTIRAPR